MGTKTSLRQKLNIGCLNVRGCQHLEERKTLIEDCQKYELQIFAVSETHLAGTSLEQDVTSDTDNTTTKYAFFHTGSDDNTHHGVGLIIDQDLPPTFKRISDRIQRRSHDFCLGGHPVHFASFPEAGLIQWGG